MPAVAAVAAIGALGYGIYSGERASAQAKKQYADAQSQAERDRARQEAQLNSDNAAQQAAYDKQVADQKALNDQLRADQDANLTKIRGEIPGMTDKLGADLLEQENAAYARMTPQMEARLNALGLLQSGALPEAQAKAQRDLESQRQAALTQFRTNADTQLNITQPLANSSADVQRQYDALHNNLQTSQNNLAQTFANQNVYDQNQAATQQYLYGLQSANNSAAQSSANSYMNLGGQIGGGALSYYGGKSSSGSGYNPSLEAFYNAGYGTGPNQGLGPSWNGGYIR